MLYGAAYNAQRSSITTGSQCTRIAVCHHRHAIVQKLLPVFTNCFVYGNIFMVNFLCLINKGFFAMLNISCLFYNCFHTAYCPEKVYCCGAGLCKLITYPCHLSFKFIKNRQLVFYRCKGYPHSCCNTNSWRSTHNHRTNCISYIMIIGVMPVNFLYR